MADNWFSDKNAEIDYLKSRIARQEAELTELRERRKDAELLVAGAMRQGFTNDRQQKALLYAFMRLGGMEINSVNERLAMVVAIEVQPHGWNAPTLPPAEERKSLPPHERQDYNDDNGGTFRQPGDEDYR